ncbi:hypothetical protein JB92DRAFT_832809 [Gautieria morchelliformis]|nr:hypothetical protein JB92DRAFT_832809 [Gautieria morchelliformis]
MLAACHLSPRAARRQTISNSPVPRHLNIANSCLSCRNAYSPDHPLLLPISHMTPNRVLHYLLWAASRPGIPSTVGLSEIKSHSFIEATAPMYRSLLATHAHIDRRSLPLSNQRSLPMNADFAPAHSILRHGTYPRWEYSQRVLHMHELVSLHHGCPRVNHLHFLFFPVLRIFPWPFAMIFKPWSKSGRVGARYYATISRCVPQTYRRLVFLMLPWLLSTEYIYHSRYP